MVLHAPASTRIRFETRSFVSSQTLDLCWVLCSDQQKIPWTLLETLISPRMVRGSPPPQKKSRVPFFWTDQLRGPKSGGGPTSAAADVQLRLKIRGPIPNANRPGVSGPVFSRLGGGRRALGPAGGPELRY